MILAGSDAETLRDILENIHNPDALDSHPWVSRPLTHDAVLRNDKLRNKRPGEQLIGAIQESFPKIMPSTPPRRGKRLDTRWGEFGILAAQYFAPLQFGTPVSNSLRDAWGRIDQAILLYVYGSGGASLSENEAIPYRLVGGEPEVAPISTLSDWHCKGIQRLADAIFTHEQYLTQQSRGESTYHGSRVHSEQQKQYSIGRWIPAKALSLVRRIFSVVVLALIVLFLILGGIKARRIYVQVKVVRQDVAQIQDLLGSTRGLGQISKVGPELSLLRYDFDLLKDEVTPVLWVGPWLKWVPVYGGDLAASRDLLELVDLFLESVDESYAAFQTLLVAFNTESKIDPPQIIALLEQAQPELTGAQQSFDRAAQLRDHLDIERLSPEIRSVIEEDLDRMMPLLRDGLTVSLALPDFLGASDEGPKTYLMLAQNEDELRATGGFITAAGTLVVQGGQVLNLSFADTGELDNWEKPYPPAPWQLEEYMNSPVLVLRDANWFTDFPTTALYAESLYAYHNAHSVDGVVAFDQHMLVIILQALGPVEVEGAPFLIDANNVIPFMRTSKSPPAGQPVEAGWSRKAFMDKITRAILAKIFEGDDISWEQLGKALLQGLDEKHLLLELDDSAFGEVVASRGWNGAIRPGRGDFLMVVDSNIGFNKTNAVVETDLVYDVDLTDLTSPTSKLMVTHRNNASADVPCIHWDFPILAGEEYYPINACYWNYMRVYTPDGAKLLDASPQIVPDDWMILNHGVPGKVDVLEEEIDGVQAYGTLMVVPGGELLDTGFHFDLPCSIIEISSESNKVTYHLEVKKQPGTLAIPLTIHVHVPSEATIISISPGAVYQENQVLIQADLRRDINIDIIFSYK